MKREGLCLSYKGKTNQRYVARMRILETLESEGMLSISKQTIRSALLEDRGGDALDSVIAAFVTFKALHDQDLPAVGDNDPYLLEGQSTEDRR